jgi:hypothetical protein
VGVSSWLKTFCDLHGLDERVAAATSFGQLPHRIDSSPGQQFDGTIQAIRIGQRYGRFGNNFYQLLNALMIARRLACRELQIPPIDASPSVLPMTIEEIRVTGFPAGADVKPTLVGSFYAPVGFERFLGDFGSPFAFDTVHRYVRPIFRELLAGIKPLGRNVLAMHFRGGDVFATDSPAHCWYVQPPASYYIAALEFAQRHFGVDSACLVFEDRSNPAIDNVEHELARRHVPCTLQSADLIADLRFLLGAQHIVQSYGTFCEAIAILSECCESFFGFRRFSTQHDMEAFPQSRVEELVRHNGARTVLIEDTDQQYIPPKGWDASDKQLDLLRNFPQNLLTVREISAPPDPIPVLRTQASSHQQSRIIPNALDCHYISAKRHQEALKLGGLLTAKNLNLQGLAAGYENYVFANLPEIISLVQSRINTATRKSGLLESPDATAFLDMGEISRGIHGALLPGREYPYFDRLEAPPRQEFVVFQESRNEFFDPLLPRHISMVSHRHVRSRFSIFGMRGATLFVQPNGYQLHDGQGKWYVHWASSRAHTRRILEFPSVKTDKDLVIVQDRFWGASFTHFLYDYVTRIYHFCESGVADPRKCIFVLGGAPTEFHELVLSSLCGLLGLTPENFHFPLAGHNMVSAGRTFWFTDQHGFMHPAQMVHPRSIAAIRRIIAGISVPAARWPYIYLSRGDAGARRLQNEAQIVPRLEALGFKSVRLAELPILEQLGLLRGATLIVAPHGMGLSNIIFNDGPLRVVELHSPFGGTEAYALIARALGFSYDYVLGSPTDAGTGDFTIRWEDLEHKILPWIGADKPPEAVITPPAGTINLLPASENFGAAWHAGFQQVPAAMGTSNKVPAYLVGHVIMRHRLDGIAQSPDTNAGYFEIPPLDPSTIYCASCWVWIPEDFAGQAIQLSVGEWDGQSWVWADLSKRGCWQRISSTVRSPAIAPTCSIVLRGRSLVPCEVFSTCWQLESGPVPTSYVPTRQAPPAI